MKRILWLIAIACPSLGISFVALRASAPAAAAVPAAVAESAKSVPTPPVELMGGEGCTHATKAALGPDCFQPAPDERGKVGTFCELHPRERLMLDTVRVMYGFICPPVTGERQGLYMHSRVAVCAGCVVGKPYTEVAFCPACRRARAAWERAHPEPAER